MMAQEGRDETKRTHPLRQRTYSSEAADEMSITDTTYSDQNFVMLTRKLKQNYQRTEQEEKNIIDNIAERIRKEICDDDVASLTNLPLKYFCKVLEALLLKNKTTELLSLWERSRKKMAAIPVKFARNCRLTLCLRNSLLMTETEQIAFLEAIIAGGVGEDIETGEEQKQIMQVLVDGERHNVCLLLMKRGVSPEFYRKKERQPLFLAISLALEKGDCIMLEYLISLYQRNKKMQCLNPNQQDAAGRSLFHYVCIFDGPIENAVKVGSTLSRFKVKVAMVDHQGKTPNDYLKRGDERKKFVSNPSNQRKEKITERIKESKKEQLEDVAKPIIQDSKPNNKEKTENLLQFEDFVKPKIQDSKPNDKEKTENLLPKTNDSAMTWIPNETHTFPSSKIKLNSDSILMETESIKESLEERESSSQESDISEGEEKDKEDIQEKFIDPDSEVKTFKDINNLLKDVKVTINGIQLPNPQVTGEEDNHGEIDQQLSQQCNCMENEISEVMVTESLWQVELSPEVVAFLRNTFVDRTVRLKTIQGILRLASGDKMQYQAEPILTKRKDLSMYQSSFTESEQIIWEKAVTYNNTDVSGQYQRIYSQVIRVWDVLNSEKKFRSFIKKIQKVKRNSRKCTQQRKLVAYSTKKLIDNRELPFKYHRIENAESETYDLKFAPPANSERGEYNLIKFQNLTPELIDIILRDPDREASFPFNVLEMEHVIIEMDFSVPIVLQGRSGTGKTTCCLFRLWKQFASFWEEKLSNDEQQIKEKTEPYEGPDFEELEQQTIQAMKEENELVYSEDDSNLGQLSTDNDGCLTTDFNGINEQLEYDDYSQSSREEEPLFRQLFITKSQFLCQQVREQLNLLMNGVDWTKEHVEMTKQPLPYRLEDLGHHHYPLVVNSHQFLLMLDASLGEPYFFARNEDFSLEYEIPGWNYDTSEGIVGDSDESDDDSDDESTAQGKAKDQSTDLKKKTVLKKTKRSKMREVTYEIFERDVWSKIKHRTSREIKCHPSMIWKEIISFIKGSNECMLPHSRGYLSLEDYIKVGRKKAPDFDTEDRKIVYDLFELFENHKKKMNYFDETDVIRFIVQRMHKKNDFEHLMFDQVYVDETQDFTLAELWLLVRMSTNPSQMFLAGDTAQAIMHGISFRFSDVVSLFQLFDEKYKKSLKILHLRENYRSHNGVLDLAASIVDVIMEYFNESFDVLDRDLGMYPGPKPAIIDCYNEQDLLLLLNNKQQKIEFGAHQVVLVLDEESKKYLPEQFRKAIILTIPESKGLEFDDVLIFNFFKDSKAEKQWRIVTKFLQKLAETKDDKSLKRRVALAQDRFPRQKDYEPKQDRILCTLLKKLYTAVSRARVNVWIYDSSEEERQHMYNYFRMRNLVETVTKDNIEDRVFTKKTSKEEWVRQGEKLMKRKIYREAVKCFVNGQDKKMTELSLAFHQMITADRQVDRRIKTQMYLAAANRFILCGNYIEAERCLRKARRKDITAKFFENTGKFESAGKLYHRLADTSNSIRCFKEARRYDLAIHVLDERQMFKEARSLCEEYHILRTKPELSDQLESFQPKLYYSVDFFAYKEAECHHKDGNERLMNEALREMKDFKRAIDFLLQRGFVEDALALFTEKNSPVEACKLYLKYGQIDEAIRIAKRSRKQVLIAKCDLLYSQFVTRDSNGRYVEMNRKTQDVMKKISSARNTFEHGRYEFKNEAGESYLLLGMILQNDKLIGRAFGKFSHTYPKNLAGMLECMDWMTNNAKLSSWKKMTQVILGMENLADVLELLRAKESSADLRSVRKILDFYGFHGHEDENLVEIYPAQKPIALQFLNSECRDLQKGPSHPFLMDKWQARRSLAEFLLNRGKGWIRILRREMLKHRNMKVKCPFRDLGECCNPMQCELAHKDLDDNDHRNLLIIDLWFMALDFYSNRSPGLVDEKVYQSVKWFVADLMSNSTFLRNIQELRKLFSSTVFKKYFSQVHPFVPHIKSFVIEYIENRKQSLTLSNHYLSSDVLIEILLLYNLFSLQPLELNLPINTVCDFEQHVKREFFANRVSKKALLKKQFKFKEEGRTSRIQCIARKYYKALDMLLRKNDPYAALKKYVGYVSHHEMKDLEFVKNANIAMWMEYMVTVGLVALAKIKRCLVFIPTGYLDTVEMIDLVYERTESVLKSIKLSKTFFPQNSISCFMDKLADGMIKLTKCFTFAIEGNDESTMRLLRRIITTDITLLCNMNIALTSQKESGLVQHLHKLSYITSLMNESRFKQALIMLPMTKTQKGMCLLLRKLHEGQENQLSVFHWSQDETFEKIALISEKHMCDKDYDIEVPLNQLATTNETNTDEPNDSNILHAEKDASDSPLDDNQEDKEKAMARKFFKRWILKARVRHMKRHLSRQINVEFRQRTEALFKDAFVDESTEECGICGLAVNEMQRDQARERSPSSELIFKIHLASEEHKLKSYHFSQFLHLYIEQFSKPILECERLIDIHDLKKEQPLTSGIENCRRDLIRLSNDHNGNIISVLETRDWANINDVLATEKELSKTVKIVKNYIRTEKAKKVQEESQGKEIMKDKLPSIDSNDDNDDEDDDGDDDVSDDEGNNSDKSDVLCSE